jgi:hypothetical protein
LSALKNALAAAIGVATLVVLSFGRVSMRCTCAAPGRASHDDRIACISLGIYSFYLSSPKKEKTETTVQSLRNLRVSHTLQR